MRAHDGRCVGDSMTRSITLLLLGALVSNGCGEVSAPDARPLSGSFVLTQVNGKALPDTLTVLPNRDPTQPGCAILRTGGTLVLDPVGAKFSISVNAKTCNGTEGVLLNESGTYRQDAQTLIMTEAGPMGPFSFHGEIGAHQITVHGFYEYTFAH